MQLKRISVILIVFLLTVTMLPFTLTVEAAWIDRTSSTISDGDTDVPMSTWFSINGNIDAGAVYWTCNLYDNGMNYMTGLGPEYPGYSPFQIYLPGVPYVTTLEDYGCAEYTWYYIIVYVEDISSSDTYSIHFQTGAGGGGGGPAVTTDAATDITPYSAILNGELGYVDGTWWYCYFQYGYTTSYELGYLWAGYLSEGDSFYANTSDNGNLIPDTEYHFRAGYTDSGSIYEHGDDLSFNTGPYPPDEAPIVTTLVGTTDITHSKATIHGFLDYDGNLSGNTPCTVRFQYGEDTSYGTNTSNQTIYDTSPNFEAILTGLSPDTTYHFRAYSNNTAGESIGTEGDFHTLSNPDLDAPLVDTSAVTSIGTTTATLWGILKDGCGVDTTLRFNYGETTGYGSNSTNDSANLGTQYVYAGGYFEVDGPTPRLYEYYVRNMSRTSNPGGLYLYPNDVNSMIINGVEYDGSYVFMGGYTHSYPPNPQVWNDHVQKFIPGQDIYPTLWFYDAQSNIPYGTQYQARIRDIVSDGSSVYVVGMDDWMESSARARVFKYSASTLTKLSESVMEYCDYLYSVDTDGTYVYAGGDASSWTFPGPITYYGDHIYKYWASNLTRITQSERFGNDVTGLVHDDTYIYASHSKLAIDDTYLYAIESVKIYQKSDLAYQSTLTVAGGNTVKQYWLSNLTLKATSSAYSDTISDIADDRRYVYVVGDETVSQYWKSNMSKRFDSETYSEDGQVIAIGVNAGDNYTYSLPITGLLPDTTYHFRAYAENEFGGGFGIDMQFTTLPESVSYHPPIFGTPIPANSSTGNSLSVNWQIPITDTGGTFDWTIQCSNGQHNQENGATTGVKSLVLSGLPHDTTYRVYVNATDGINTTRAWFTFKTVRQGEQPAPPIITPVDNETRYTIPVPELPKYTAPAFTVPEMYRLLHATNLSNSDAEITVMVIDSGVIPITYNNIQLNKISTIKGMSVSNQFDENGHGTWVNYAVAYMLQTKVRNARQISYRVFGADGSCTTGDFVTALNTAKQMHVDIVSISAGVLGAKDDAFVKAVEDLRNSGIIVIVAAGNFGPSPGSIASPGISDSVIAVAASDPILIRDESLRFKGILDLKDDIICPWSSRGPVVGTMKPDVTAPGESIMGPWLYDERTLSGTSMATPLISGGIALVYANNKLEIDIVRTLYFWDKSIIPQTFEESIEASCLAKGDINSWGAGIVQFDTANSNLHSSLILKIIIWFAFFFFFVLIIYYAYHRNRKSTKKSYGYKVPKWTKKL